jgi:hypothetical protein
MTHSFENNVYLRNTGAPLGIGGFRKLLKLEDIEKNVCLKRFSGILRDFNVT